MAADILEESFEGEGYENSWDETLGSGCTIDEDNTDISPPTGGGSEILKQINPGYADENKTVHSLASEKSDSYTTFYYRLNGLSNNAFHTVFVAQDASWHVTWRIDAKRSGGTYTLYLSLYYNGSLQEDVDSVNISLDTWYKIDVKYDVTGTAWEWRLDDVSQGSGSLTGSIAGGIQTLELKTTTWNASHAVTAYWDRIWIDSSEYGYGVTGYTLTCEAGSYAYTGTAMIPLASRLLGIGAGSYAITGQDVQGLYSRLISAEGGSYTLSGQDMDFLRNYLIPIGAGSYSISGQAIGVLCSRIISANSGSYAISGQDASLFKGYLIPIEAGTYNIAGQGAGVLYSRIISLDGGTYLVTGTDADLVYTSGYVLECESGTYLITGQVAQALYSRIMAAEAGAYNITGQSAQALHHKLLSIGSGVYAITGQTANLLKSSLIVIDSGVYAITGQDVVLYWSGKPPTYYTVLEKVGCLENTLKSRKIYDGGEDIITRFLSSIWQEISKVSTTWQSSHKKQKDV